MAITNKPPYDHYKYETIMVYTTPYKKYDKAPKCTPFTNTNPSQRGETKHY